MKLVDSIVLKKLIPILVFSLITIPILAIRIVKDYPDSRFYESAWKRVIADITSKEDIEFFKHKGCLVRHRLRKETSFDCPKEIVPKLKVREARVYHIMDLEADKQIGADLVWAEGIDGSGVNVAILDTGIQFDHPELADSYMGGYDFVDNDEIPEDPHGHGTHVAGIITGNGVSQIASNYATGVAPGAGVYMLRVCDANGYCMEDDIMAAMEYAVYNLTDIKIMSISLGGGLYTGENCDTDPLAQKVNWVVENGITVAAAAGNDPRGVSSPGCASGAIAVGAVDKEGYVPDWSGRGKALDIVAPGVDILSSYSCLAVGDCTKIWYAYMSGTSMATPHIAGTVALLLQANPSLTINKIKDALYTTADPARCCRRYWRGICIRPLMCTPDEEGAGIVNAYEAYLAVKPVAACFVNADCDDGNPCTNDICVNPGTAEAYCENMAVADGTACDDGQFCTVDDVCTAGVCSGEVRNCSDGVDCTVDSCDETNDVCVNTPDNSYCQDGLFCNGEEVCDVSLGCQPGTPVYCNDDNECTVDNCNEESDACEYINIPDNTECSGGICCSGTCTVPVCSADIDCNDNNPCTIDTCIDAKLCSASCSYTTITECINGDGCCPAGCYEIDTDCVTNTMHVEDITITTIVRDWGRLFFARAIATVTILDNSGDPVEGAMVYGSWSGLYSKEVSGDTNSEGKVSFRTRWVREPGNFEFCVNDVIKTDWTYDESISETCDNITIEGSSSRSWSRY